MFQDAWKSVVMKVTGEVAPATAPQVAPESVGSKKKKRTRDEVSSSTSVGTLQPKRGNLH
jgi:hypothetical protein